MIESTARVERNLAESPARPGYLWEVPQKPVSVYLPFELIDRLENLVVENFRSLTSRGSEIGGLLVGRSGQGGPLVVLVENFEIISCDYSRGPLYRLSEADMGRFERVMEQYSGSGPRVVGYFRSHTRKGLSLDPDDGAFLDARFREPHQFSLLIRPFASKPSTGAIFIRENGIIRAEGSYLEFPFRSSQLTPTANPPKIETAAAAEPPASAAASAPAAQKPPVRGQIVPIASRREIAVPPPEPVAQPAPTPVMEAPQPAPVQASTPAPAAKPPAEPAMRAPEKKVEKPAEKKVEKKAEAEKVEKKPEKAPEKPAAKRGELAVPKAFAEAEASSAAAASAGGGSKLVWVVAALAIAAVLGGGYMLYPGFHKGGRVPTGASDTTDLGLRVEHSGPDLLLTWNRDSYGAKNGKHGVLQVFDGESHQNYEIDREQLTSGLGVVYSPQTQDVSFQMSVTDEKGVEIGKGGQRVLHPRPSPMDDPKATSASAKTTTPPAATKADTAAPETAAPATPAEPAPAAAEKATRKFDAASLGKLRPASPTDLSGALPDAPTIGGAAPQTASLPGGNLSGIAPPPPKQGAAPPPPPSASKSGASQISQAVLVYKVDPEYPKAAQQMGQKGIVELVATIGVDGRVRGVKVLKGPPILQKAAQEAVMRWVYKPTLLNGVPVENETHISINFAGK